jgi:DNA replication protein DnaC
MHVLRADAAIPLARLRAKRYFNCGLLIIDEVGFRPLDRTEASLFFRLVSTRYERGSIVLTSNKHVRDWPEIFAGTRSLLRQSWTGCSITSTSFTSTDGATVCATSTRS